MKKNITDSEDGIACGGDVSANSGRAPASSYFRWVICGLLFFSTTVNYMDRQVISYLKEFFCTPVAQGGFGWTNTDFANVTAAFTAFYAGMTILVGWLIDKIGTKIGLAVSLVVWSIFGILNAFVGRLTAMHMLVRSAFAVGEAGNFPASIKTVAEWFPKRERALATGIFNSGSNAGAMIAALFVPWCMVHFGDRTGWKMAFILTGSFGLLWLILWFWLYDTPARHKRLSKAEFDYIHSDDASLESAVAAQVPAAAPRAAQSAESIPGNDAAADRSKVSWLRLLGYRQMWAFFAGKFLTDGIWWFYLFWLPDYLNKQFGMTREQVMMPTFIVYGVAIVGSIYGGGIPMTFIRKGMQVYNARMTAMLIIAVCPLVVLSTQYFGNISHFGKAASVLAVAIICVGAAAHQAWSANLFTTVSDMFPKKAIASVIGIGTFAGGIGGVIVQKMAGALTDGFKQNPQTAYLIMFVVCGLSYLIAWSFMKALVPRYRPITDL